MKPVIGITTYGRHEQSMKSTHYDSFYVPPVDYAQAVRRAGGIAIYWPPGEDVFPAVLSRLDGIIFTGGTVLTQPAMAATQPIRSLVTSTPRGTKPNLSGSRRWSNAGTCLYSASAGACSFSMSR